MISTLEEAIIRDTQFASEDNENSTDNLQQDDECIIASAGVFGGQLIECQSNQLQYNNTKYTTFSLMVGIQTIVYRSFIKGTKTKKKNK